MNLQEMIRLVGEELGVRVNFTLVIMTFALLMARLLPVIMLSPFLGGEVVPTEVKIGIGFTLGLVLWPAIADHLTPEDIRPVAFVLLMLKELFIGLSLSFIVGMIFNAALIGGGLIDTMAGTNQAQLHVPQLGQQVTLFSTLKLQLSVTLFLTLNGHHVVIASFGDSLAAIPLDGFPTFGAGAWPFFDLLTRVFQDMFKIALALSAPVVISNFTTDLALGLINRVAPQVQVFFIAMQIKPMVTVLVMMVSMHLVLERLSREYEGLFGLLRSAIRLLT